MQRFALLFVMLSISNVSATETRGNWVINGQDQILRLIDKKRYVWASEKCQETCMWSEHRQKYQLPLAKDGGANPYNQLCSGDNKVVVSTSALYGTLSFCLFSDGSIMSTNGFVK